MSRFTTRLVATAALVATLALSGLSASAANPHGNQFNGHNGQFNHQPNFNGPRGVPYNGGNYWSGYNGNWNGYNGGNWNGYNGNRNFVPYCPPPAPPVQYRPIQYQQPRNGLSLRLPGFGIYLGR